MNHKTIITIQLIFGLISTIYIVYQFTRDLKDRNNLERLDTKSLKQIV